MRICSLVPTATEILFALGLGESLVGVSAQCELPADADGIARVVELTVKLDGCSSAEVDAIIRQRLRDGAPLYHVDAARLAALRPELIVTQELCDVCAIGAADVRQAISSLRPSPRIISLHAHTLLGVFEEIRLLGEETGRAGNASSLIQALQSRLEQVRRRISAATRRPRVFCVEWLDPLMACGHWVPEMVEWAGGVEVVGKPAARSRVVDWSEVIDAQPEVLILMPCGIPIPRIREELGLLRRAPGWDQLPAVQREAIYLVDGPSYFNRAGPKLVDGVELLASLLHPEEGWPPVPAQAMEHVGSAGCSAGH
jgi:iron complex transport system substrate-binding protein